MNLSFEEKKNIVNIWYQFIMQEKKIPVKHVHDIIPKEMLSETQLKDPKINEQIKKLGEYRTETKIQEKNIKALDQLVKLKYVKKTKEKIYRVYFNFIAHPYIPHVYPGGRFGILSSTKFSFTHFDFYEKEYKIFFETAKEFENERKSGNHTHITTFEFHLGFSYDTEVYELKDDFFDAMSLNISSSNKKLIGHFTKPEIRQKCKGTEIIEKKNLKSLSEFTEEQFLKGSEEMRKEVKKLDWKKNIVGIIKGFDNRIYTIPKLVRAKKSKKQNSLDVFQSPNFFGKKLYSLENITARIFEDSIAEYIRNNEHYSTTTRYIPSYLGKEIDIFGERGSKKNKEIILCEAKFRFDEIPITKDELTHFHQKAGIIKKNESKKENISFRFWFVTTTKKIEPDAKKFLQETKIEFMVAKLPTNWKKQSDWTVTKISEKHKRQNRR